MKLLKPILLFTALVLLSFAPQRITIFEHGATISGKWHLLSRLMVDSSQYSRDSTFFPMDTSSYFSFGDNGEFTAWVQGEFDTTGSFLNQKYIYNEAEKQIIITDGTSKDTFFVQTLIHNKMDLFRKQKIFSGEQATIVKQWIHLKRK